MNTVKLFSIIFLFAIYQSCSSYGDPSNIPFKDFNDSIRVGASNAERWTQNPESISKHLFPTETHPEGNRTYSVQSKCSSTNNCEVTVIDEGPIDDEVYGQRYLISFEKKEKYWQIVEVNKSLKRRY